MTHGRASTRLRRWSLFPLAAMLGLSLAAVTGCTGGDNGSNGPSGPGGQPGPTGPTGPTGPGTVNSVPITTGTFEGIVPTITKVTVPADSGKPVVEFRVVDEQGRMLSGLEAANVSFAIARLQSTSAGQMQWQAITRRTEEAGTGSWPGTTATTQGATEPSTAGTLTQKDDGTYTYTFATDLRSVTDVPYDATLVHRIGIEIRNYDQANSLYQSNSPYTFLPSTGAVVANSGHDVVSDETCQQCHDILEFHGGVRTDTQYCVVCHNTSSTDAQSGNTVDMAVMIHKIHAGATLPSVLAGKPYQIWGRGNALTDFSAVLFPADVRDCTSCHVEGDGAPAQAANWRTQVGIRACGSCHDDVNFQTGANHSGISATDADCSTCHGPDKTFGLRPDEVHFVPERRTAGKFAYELLEVTGTAPGQTPTVRFRVTDPTAANAVYNIATDAPFTQCAGGNSRLSIDIGWSTVPDYTNTGSGLTPAQPIQLNPLTACGGSSTANGDGTFTATSLVPMPATATGTAIVAMEGHPAVDANGDGTLDRIPVTNVHKFVPVTDAQAVPRRNVVDIARCDDCHGKLSVHGNNRTDDIQVCATCHNPNATDITRRVAGSQCVTELGTDDAPIDFKYMIHALHAAKIDVCGFGNSAISFAEVKYPGRLDNCEGCHLPDTYYPVDSTAVLATTVDAGANVFAPTDDRAITPNSAACSACHDSPEATAHMQLNGGSFNASKNADGTLASGTTETCSLCHGPGRTADVKEAHQVPLFPSNAMGN